MPRKRLPKQDLQSIPEGRPPPPAHPPPPPPPPPLPPRWAGWSDYDRYLNRVLLLYKPQSILNEMEKKKYVVNGQYADGYIGLSAWENVVKNILADKVLPRKYFNRLVDDYMKRYKKEGKNIDDSLLEYGSKRRNSHQRKIYRRRSSRRRSSRRRSSRH